eukprot:CCRYP_018790-RA/>CCRYP_018790-RA protein AED:0.11 eAED:-0.01 QI:0/0/0/1/1/1/2/0/208
MPTLCAERRLKLKADEEAIILAQHQIMMLAQKELIGNGLRTMKKAVRKMTVKDFYQTFGCDIIDMTKKQLEEGEEEGAMGTKRGVGAKPAVGVSLITPTAYSLYTFIIHFLINSWNDANFIFKSSINGSPVDQFDKGGLVVTAKKRKALPPKQKAPLSHLHWHWTGNGKCIDLSDPNEQMKLDGEKKALAKEQIMAMQEQMKNLMANW